MPRFECPTHEEPMRTNVLPLRYFRLTYARSIVRVSGAFRFVLSPSTELLTAAGDEGTDWFIGGHIYDVTDEIAEELEGIGVVPEPSSQGFGQGPFGSGPFGG